MFLCCQRTRSVLWIFSSNALCKAFRVANNLQNLVFLSHLWSDFTHLQGLERFPGAVVGIFKGQPAVSTNTVAGARTSCPLPNTRCLNAEKSAQIVHPLLPFHASLLGLVLPMSRQIVISISSRNFCHPANRSFLARTCCKSMRPRPMWTGSNSNHVGTSLTPGE